MHHEEIQNRIYHVRGQQVMLSYDLAILYSVEPRALIQAVKRNISRFPPDFMFQLSSVEFGNLKSQIVISNTGRGGRRHAPYAFTEHGIAMLSSVLKSERASQINIAIIRVFIKLRHALASHRDLARKFEKLEGRVSMHETDIRLILEDVRELKKKRDPENPINPSVV